MSINKQSGAVSLFVVVFAMLIITVVTLSFLRLMMTDQQQASDADLSQSAYDSALAGVEDVKRALLRYQQVCNNSPGECEALSGRLSSDVCNAVVLEGGVIGLSDTSGGTPSNPGEIKVQQSISGDELLDQAYTCVTVKLETDDYVGKLSANQSQLVPIIGADNFDTVTIRWFNQEDSGNTAGTIDLANTVGRQPLLQQSAWPSNRPAVMRTQLMQFGDSFTLDSFDVVNSSGESNSNALFLYPTSTGSSTDAFVGRDVRKSTPGGEPTAGSASTTPLPIKCEASVGGGGYACSVSLRLPTPIGGGDRTAFLRVTPFYNASHFQVVLTQGGVPGTPGVSTVKFKDVQPEIDATGRANDLFRRVQSRVDLYDVSFPFPDAAVDVTGHFCKDFSVTDTEYFAGSCTP